MKSSTETGSAALAKRILLLTLTLTAASLALAGCGYKGDLVLADPAAEGAAAKTGDEDADAKPSAQED